MPIDVSGFVAVVAPPFAVADAFAVAAVFVVGAGFALAVSFVPANVFFGAIALVPDLGLAVAACLVVVAFFVGDASSELLQMPACDGGVASTTASGRLNISDAFMNAFVMIGTSSFLTWESRSGVARVKAAQAIGVRARCKVGRLTPITESFPATGGEKLLAIAALVVAAVMLFSGLGSVPLMQPDEGRNAEVAREMMVSSSWLVPTLEGHPYLDKPAAYFAAVALSLRVFGVNEWGARMPSALCGLVILILLYAFARQQYDRATAALAVIVVATTPLMFAFSRIVIMDIALAVCTVAAILASFVAEDGKEPDRRWHAAGAACAGLGMLVKGPVGALVPAAVLVVFFWVDGRRGALRRVFAPLNFVIVLGVFLPWFAALVNAHPEFAHYGLVEETFNRFFTPAFNRGQPFWYFGPALLVSLMPWTVLFVPMAIAVWPARNRLTRADRLFIVWTIVVILFFSISRTKQPGYILSGVIAAAVCVARGLGTAWRNNRGRAARLVAGSSLALSIVAVALAATLGWAVANGATNADRLSAMQAPLRAFLPLWTTLLIMLFSIALLAAVAFARKSAGYAAAAFACFPLVLVTAAFPGVAEFGRGRSAMPLATSLALLPRDTEIAAFEGYPAGLSFYLGRTITIVSDTATPLRSNFILYWLRNVEVRPATLVAPSTRDAWLASRTGPVQLVAPEGQRRVLESWLDAKASVTSLAPGWCGAAVPRGEGR